MPEDEGDCRVLSRYRSQTLHPTPVWLRPIRSSPGGRPSRAITVILLHTRVHRCSETGRNWPGVTQLDQIPAREAELSTQGTNRRKHSPSGCAGTGWALEGRGGTHRVKPLSSPLSE